MAWNTKALKANRMQNPKSGLRNLDKHDREAEAEGKARSNARKLGAEGDAKGKGLKGKTQTWTSHASRNHNA